MEHIFDKSELSIFRTAIPRTQWLSFENALLPCRAASSLDDYALLRGWTREGIQHLKNNPLACGNNGLGLIQSMMCFAPWEALSGNIMKAGDFIYDLEGRPFLQTTALRNVVDLLARAAIREGLQPSSPHHLSIEDIYDDIVSWENAFLSLRLNSNQQFVSTARDLQRQISMLKDDLVYLIHILPVKPNKSRFHHTGIFMDMYEPRLKAQGWCPSLYKKLEDMSISAMEYFLATCHHPHHSANLHDSCDGNECQVQKFSTNPLKANHVTVHCTCHSIGINVDAIDEILLSGNYFLINIGLLAEKERFVQDALVCYSSATPYVAISHVWAHGLGSTADQGLPLCQVHRLCDLIGAYNRKAGIQIELVWIDSLCIPQKEKPKLASIAIMDQIYQNADAVLSLDKALQDIATDGMSIERQCLYILTSNWNTRLWTLQEAKLANELFISFKDNIISVNRLQEVLAKKLFSGQATSVTGPCYADLQGLVGRNRELFEWLSLLKFRLCTNPADEYLVISRLCGLDTACLTSKTGAARTIRFWEMFEYVPQDIIFHACPKLEEDNFRWAPRSLLSGSNETAVDGDRSLEPTVTSEGLLGTYFILEIGAPLGFQSPQSELNAVVALRVFDLYIYLFRRDNEWNQHSSLLIDTVAFIRDPFEHVRVLKNTEISAVGLLRLGVGRRNVARYRLQYQLLGTIKWEGSEVQSDNMRFASKTILIA